MIHYYHKTLKEKAAKKLLKYKPGAIEVITEASREDLAVVARSAKLQVEDLVDIFDTQEIPRLEQVGKTTLLIIRVPKPMNAGSSNTQVLMVVFHQKRLTLITAEKLDLLDEILNQKRFLATTQGAKLLIHILLEISKRYASSVNRLHRLVDEVRQRIRRASNSDVETLIEYETVLNDYLSALVPMQGVYQELRTGKYIPLYAEDESVFEDLMHSTHQSAGVCQVSVKNIISLRDAFEIVVTNRLNQTVKFLTSVTIIITIPTIISSIYGMNVPLPAMTQSNVFWWIAGATVATMALVAWIFRKNRWF